MKLIRRAKVELRRFKRWLGRPLNLILLLSAGLLIILAQALTWLQTIDHTAGCPSVCGRHGIATEHVFVDIRYGMPPFKSKYLDAKRIVFPEANSFAEGGCVVDPFTTRARVRDCRECRDVEQAYIASQPGMVAYESLY